MFHSSLLMTDNQLFRPDPEGSTTPVKASPFRGRLIAGFVRWLLAPIDFPGKWPNDAAQPERYNKNEGDGMDYYRSTINR